MRELNFDTGVVEYQVNGGAVLRFNPADGAFVERLHGLFEKLSRQPVEEKELRKDLDDVFGGGTTQAVFGEESPNALAGGLPLWANFLLAVLDEVEAAVRQQQEAASPRVEYYMKKYAAYRQ